MTADKSLALVSVEQHNRWTAGPTEWTATRIAADQFQTARAVYGAETEEDDARIYRTLQAYEWKRTHTNSPKGQYLFNPSTPPETPAAQPGVSEAQAERIVAALDPSDGGQDVIAAFVRGLAAQPAPAAQQPAAPVAPAVESAWTPSEAAIVAGARALNQLTAEGCGVDPRDQWNIYGDSMKNEVRQIIAAALSAGSAPA